MSNRVYPMIPAGNGPVWFAVITLVVMIGASVWAGIELYNQDKLQWLPILILPMMIAPATMFYIARASRNITFEVSRDELIISGFKGRKIPIADLDLDRAKVLDLNIHSDYKVRGNIQGTKMPGFKTGWGKLRNKQKALIYLTDESKVCFIPLKEDYVLLLSVSQPKKMLDSLHASV